MLEYIGNPAWNMRPLLALKLQDDKENKSVSNPTKKKGLFLIQQKKKKKS